MPYIPKDDRQGLIRPDTPGRLNFVCTNAALIFLKAREKADGRRTYDALNAAVGALECAKQELYRRWGAPLEDAAAARNGDLKEFTS